MDRNTVLAFALSMIVFVSYVMYQEERRLEQALEIDEQAGDLLDERGVIPTPAAAPLRAPREPAPYASGSRMVVDEPVAEFAPRVSVLRNDQVVARISNGPALIESWRLQEFEERLPEGNVPIELLDSEVPILRTDVAGLSGASFARQRYEVLSETEKEVVQRAVNASGVFTRTIRLDPEGYGFDLEFAFESRRIDPVDAAFEVRIPARVNDRADFRELSLVSYHTADGITREFVNGWGMPGFFDFGTPPPTRSNVARKAKWTGLDVQFFSGVVIDPLDRARLQVDFDGIEPGETAQAIAKLPAAAVGSGGEVVDRLRGFLGPKTASALGAADPSLQQTVDRGWSWLEPLTRFFEIALDWLYTIIPNYGWAIIVLTILVRIVTAPLMVKQMRSAERMREVQPKIKALQERYADDRQRQSEEMMKLYREEKINPLGGCLPLLLQMPVLIGLFYALRTSIGLRHAPWIFWVNDLSQPATLFTIPGVDFPVRILPLIMGGSMYVQQKMMPQTGMDPVQARMMLIMMPGMMLLISYTFPSGLVLYWTVSNLLGIAHQYWVRNHLQPQG